MAALLITGSLLAFAIFVHPGGVSPASQNAPGGSNTSSPGATGSNGTLLTQPPVAQTGGDDGSVFGGDG